MTAQLVLQSLIFSSLTLYMMALMLRWLGPFIQLEFAGVWSIIPKVSDPLIGLVKRALPDMGPVDWSPVAAVLGVYIIRLVLVQV
jgi:uncharacterized protein YggT (Ycf19 family)